jgi:predicted histone-like DNA-binding protein
MSVQFKATPKGAPGVLGGGKIKYYASIVRGTKINLRTMLEEISELNVAHPGAVLAVLECFLSRVDYHIVNGRAVDLGQLGSFYPAISSHPADTSDEVSKESIRRFKVNFRPSQLLQERMSRAKFEKLANGTISSPLDA